MEAMYGNGPGRRVRSRAKGVTEEGRLGSREQPCEGGLG